MKLLKRICLLQFFLYERQDLEVGRNTAFLGPNGTGKTCLLDAIQTVMLGADAGRVHFNAQADGKRRDRTLRNYCLGVQDQSGHGCRSEATTYIALVFEDERTHEVVTAGVSLSAREDASEHTFHGLFILPGVDLTTDELVEQRAGREHVIPWRDIQQRFKDLVKRVDASKSAVIVPHNREEFVKKLLLDYLAAPGDNPNPEMFRNAFQRSLQLKVADDLSAALRDNLIEARPTNVREFKLRVDQFRKMRDLVRRVRDQIAAVGLVRQEFDKARRERMREANHRSLAYTLEVEEKGIRANEVQEKLDRLSAAVTHALAEFNRAGVTLKQAELAENEARDARALNPDYQARRVSTREIVDRERALATAKSQLEGELQMMQMGLAGVGRHAGMQSDVALFGAAMAVLTDVMTTVARGELPDSSTVDSLAKVVADAALAGLRRQSAIERSHEELTKLLVEAQDDKGRAADGLSELSTPVKNLRAALRQAGIDAVPVCDVTEVTQSRWQRVIEAYLGLNAQALLIPRGQEKDALAVTQQLDKSVNVFGAKMALPSRMRTWRATSAGLLAAELVRGEDENAIAFLRGILGQIECVETLDDLHASRRAFTDDGMLSTGYTVERLRLSNKLVIGRQDGEAARLEVEQRLRDLLAKVEQSRRDTERFIETMRQLTPFAAADNTRLRLGGLVSQFEGVRTALQQAQDEQIASMSGDLAALEERVRVASEARAKADGASRHWDNERTRLHTQHQAASDQLTSLQEALARARAKEQASWKDPFYDANAVNKYRERIEGRSEIEIDGYGRLIEHCHGLANQAGQRAASVQSDAIHKLSSYRTEFGVNADVAIDWHEQARFAEQEHDRLQTLTLAEKEKEAEEALAAAEQVFRTDVVQSLRTGFRRIEGQVAALNKVLQKAPEFSNRERYWFKYRPVDQHRALYNFLTESDVLESEDPLWGEASRTPPEFRDLMESDATSPLLQETSPLYDYRRFYAYDIELRREGEVIGVLSKRFGPGSGGEHRTPLYVIYGAALAAAYGNIHGRNAGGGLMLLDEAFDKMDATNVRAVADYLNSLGLQLLMAGPETDQPKLSGFLDLYYDMSRHGSNHIHMESYRVSAQARELLASDNPLLHPELLEQELERIRGQSALTSIADP